MVFIVLLSFTIAAYYYPVMPAQLISHWGPNGQPDGYASKFMVLFLMPIISAVMIVFYWLIPIIDPLKKNIEKFRAYYDWLILLIILFLFYIYLLSIVANLGYLFNMTQMMMPALGVLFIYMGFVLQHAKRNWFIGIKTPWTLSSDTVWEKTHKLGAVLFKAAGVLALVAAFFWEYAMWLVFVPIIGSSAFLIIYSYFEFEKEKKKK